MMKMELRFENNGDFSAFMVMGLNMQVCFGNDFCVLFMFRDAMDLKLNRVELILFYGYGCCFWVLCQGVWCVLLHFLE
jgi:hypothetical protein